MLYMVMKGPENDHYMEMAAVVTENLGNGLFLVRLENNITARVHLSGKLRRNFIRILLNDRVLVELSTYDLQKGRITRRYKDPQMLES